MRQHRMERAIENHEEIKQREQKFDDDYWQIIFLHEMRVGDMSRSFIKIVEGVLRKKILTFWKVKHILFYFINLI